MCFSPLSGDIITGQPSGMDIFLAAGTKEEFQDWVIVPRHVASIIAPSVSDAHAEYGADSVLTLNSDVSFDDIIRAGKEERFNPNTANNNFLEDLPTTLPEGSILQELELMSTSMAVQATGGLFGFYDQEDITSFLNDLDAVLP